MNIIQEWEYHSKQNSAYWMKQLDWCNSQASLKWLTRYASRSIPHCSEGLHARRILGLIVYPFLPPVLLPLPIGCPCQCRPPETKLACLSDSAQRVWLKLCRTISTRLAHKLSDRLEPERKGVPKKKKNRDDASLLNYAARRKNNGDRSFPHRHAVWLIIWYSSLLVQF